MIVYNLETYIAQVETWLWQKLTEKEKEFAKYCLEHKYSPWQCYCRYLAQAKIQ